MKKKKLIIVTLLLFVVLTGVFIFTSNSPGPGDLPENSAIKEEIESTLGGVKIDEIVDRQQVGDDHAFFPFITDDGQRGMSVWKVENRKWTIGASDNGGEPSLWKIDPQDPETFYIIYHLDPDDDVDKIDFYMKRERNYHVTGEHQSYVPQIMAKEEVDVSGGYGAQPAPKIWKELQNQLNTLAQPDNNGANGLFSSSHPNPHLQMLYVPYDDEGEFSRLEQTLGNQSFTNGEQMDLIIWMDPLELEEEQIQ
ncbi:hypothetical protein GCM10010954_25740 [Halobacillus andaensis]|uniref:Uncharacterized protein n=1 Tax=Halobacillus andaensis TaxID=1176239 RepID=A0A917EYP4_HALAA|nr:hypothetical protein [Halobacillus andaensis]MBP2005840.1 hypothetical protein [Halobacillus andaensis]GGF25689.1 hypothetical protein GCM10010954_25740 [Halobacillus andaensis]